MPLVLEIRERVTQLLSDGYTPRTLLLRRALFRDLARSVGVPEDIAKSAISQTHINGLNVYLFDELDAPFYIGV